MNRKIVNVFSKNNLKISVPCWRLKKFNRMRKIYLALCLMMMNIDFISAQVFADLDINHVKARVLTHGDLFNYNGLPRYEFPTGTTKHANFAAGLWIAGYDHNTTQLKVAAQTYRQSGNEYWAGPLNQGPMNATESAKWEKIWKVNKAEVDSFLTQSVHTTANTPKSILDWPAKGCDSCKDANNNILSIQAPLAPFVDMNNDGDYNPLEGDYPAIRGEQMLWWVFNDECVHGITGSDPLHVQVNAMAFACNQDPVLKNVTFYSYEVLSMNAAQYDSCVISFWDDVDLGYGFDDFNGYDSNRRMAICYNGDVLDDGVYDHQLTQTGVMVLQAPGDLPNQKLPLGSCTFYNGLVSTPTGNPTTPLEYYYYMTGRWKDGNPFTRSCTMRDQAFTAIKYLYPDQPDQMGLSEVQCGNLADDRRFVLSSEKFTLTAPVRFELAVLNTEPGSANQNFQALQTMADYVASNPQACGPTFPTRVDEIKETGSPIVYPNPMQRKCSIHWPGHAQYMIDLQDLSGRSILCTKINEEDTLIEFPGINAGFYFLKFVDHDIMFTQRLIVQAN